MQADVTIHEPQKMVSRSLIFDGEIAGDQPTRESGAFLERLLTPKGLPLNVDR